MLAGVEGELDPGDELDGGGVLLNLHLSKQSRCSKILVADPDGHLVAPINVGVNQWRSHVQAV
jgi:hypothetical protein